IGEVLTFAWRRFARLFRPCCGRWRLSYSPNKRLEPLGSTSAFASVARQSFKRFSTRFGFLHLLVILLVFNVDCRRARGQTAVRGPVISLAEWQSIRMFWVTPIFDSPEEKQPTLFWCGVKGINRFLCQRCMRETDCPMIGFCRGQLDSHRLLPMSTLQGLFRVQ